MDSPDFPTSLPAPPSRPSWSTPCSPKPTPSDGLATAFGGGEAEAWHRALDLMEGCKGHVVVAGMGKSGLVGAKISATLASLGQPSHFVHPAEAVHGDLGRIRSEDVAFLLSFSGETEEVVTLASILKADGVRRIGLSSKPQSGLARQCDVHLNLGDIVEACPPSPRADGVDDGHARRGRRPCPCAGPSA